MNTDFFHSEGCLESHPQILLLITFNKVVFREEKSAAIRCKLLFSN